MKNAFKILLGLSIACILGAGMFCTQTVEKDTGVKTDSIPGPGVSAPEWYCVPIAPMPEKTTAVGMRGKFWQVGSTIKIGFINATEAQKTLVKSAYADWKKYVNLNFEYPATGPYNIRVSFVSGGGAYSYIGVDANQIPQQSATMNLGFGGMSTALHEAAHSLAGLHEQQQINGICWNEANVIADLSKSPNFWSLAQIRFNVLDYHNPANVIAGPYDPVSILHYAIPSRWTCNGVSIPGGTVISEKDKLFFSAQYPGAIIPPDPTSKTLTPAQITALMSSALNTRTATADAYTAAQIGTAKALSAKSAAEANYQALKLALGQ